MKSPGSRSFTLLELLLVIGIILIITGIAMPNYYRSKERTLGKEAIASLRLIYAAERMYYHEMWAYYTSSTLDDINSHLGLTLNATNWTYNITASGSGYQATATRSACVYTVTDTNETPSAGASCP